MSSHAPRELLATWISDAQCFNFNPSASDPLNLRRADTVGLLCGKEELKILIEGARISLEVAWVVKLRWVNENADHDNLIFPAASFHERTVPPVKRSHCRDETNTAPINGASTCPPGSQSVGNVH